MNFEEAEEYIANIPRFTSKNEPEKTRAFLEEIGDFSIRIPTIHVAGTNGKGSVCAYLRAGLNGMGLKVGMFTSPHLVDIRERFMIDNEMISKSEFANTFNYVYEEVKEFNKKKGNEKYHPTFFEFLFFMAAVWFKTKQPDVIVLETGLGGRLDATNSISSPKVCVITEIGLDHCEYLGDTKELIAGEKAGIIKPGVPVVHWTFEEPYDDVILRRAKELNSAPYFVSKRNIKNLETTGAGVDLSIQSLYDEFVKICLNTRALYQVWNAAVAFRTMELLCRDVYPKQDIHSGIQGFARMYWPGRMEKVGENFTIDGAHNEDGIKAFLESVSIDGNTDRVLLYSAVSDKDIEKVTSLIIGSGLFRKYYVCCLKGYRAASLERLKEAFGAVTQVSFYETVAEGLQELKKEEKDVSLYAAGSLYLVGEIKALLNEEV